MHLTARLQTQALSNPVAVPVGRRVALSLPACGAGWFAATLITLPFEWLELLRNAAPHAWAWQLLEGTLLWAAFTLGVCAVLWCVVVLPMALLAPAAWVVRWRRLLAGAFPALAVLLISWKLEVWRDLIWEKGTESPFSHVVLWEYWLFGAAVALATTLVYARLLKQDTSR